MFRDKVVTYGKTLNIPGHLSLGQHVLESLRDICERKYGDQVAMINGDTGTKITYDELLKNITYIGKGLSQLGVKLGDVIGICSENSNEHMAVALGAICCGVTVTLFNHVSTKDELTHLLNLSKPKVIFAPDSIFGRHLDDFKQNDFIEHLVQLSGEPTSDGIVPLSGIMCECNEFTYEGESKFRADDTVCILYSSGTTGLPKGVMLTHVNLLYVLSSLEGGYVKGTSQNVLTVLPWHHVFGLMTTILFVIKRKTVVYLSGFKPEKYLATIQEYKINCLFLVPPVMVFLAKSPLVDQYDLSSVIGIVCGAAPLSEEVTNGVMKRFCNLKKLIEGYGMTETSLAVVLDLDDLEVPKGMLPIPGNKIKVVDIVTGEKLGPNQKGEIRVKSPSIMKGYVNNEEATRESFDEEGYLKSGDIGFYNEHDYFTIIDRLKEILKYKGHQVAPVTIENVLMQHPGVADCGVVGKPDEVAGDLPTAFVVLKPGVKLTEQDILDYTSTRLSPMSRLRGGVIFTDAIPRSSAGKILRRIMKKSLENE